MESENAIVHGTLTTFHRQWRACETFFFFLVGGEQNIENTSLKNH